MEKTFKKEVTYLANTFDASKVTDTHNGWEYLPVKKMVTFNELNQTERAQAKFHFRIVAFFTTIPEKESFGSAVGGIRVDTDMAYDLCVEYLNKFTVLDSGFTAQDLEEVLNDSGCIVPLSMWLSKEKFFPFFLKLTAIMEPSLKI